MQAECGIKQERDEEQEGTQAKVGMSMGIMEHTHSSTAMHCERQAPDGRQVLPLAPQTHRSIKETMACGPVSLTSKRWCRNPIILPFVRGRAQRVQSVLVNFKKVPGNRDQHRRLLHQLRRLFPNRRCPCFEPWHKKKKRCYGQNAKLHAIPGAPVRTFRLVPVAQRSFRAGLWLFRSSGRVGDWIGCALVYAGVGMVSNTSSYRRFPMKLQLLEDRERLISLRQTAI